MLTVNRPVRELTKIGRLTNRELLDCELTGYHKFSRFASPRPLTNPVHRVHTDDEWLSGLQNVEDIAYRTAIRDYVERMKAALQTAARWSCAEAAEQCNLRKGRR